MIDPTLEKRLHALEEFVANCFRVTGYGKRTEVQFAYLAIANVSDQIDPEYLDYLKELVERN